MFVNIFEARLGNVFLCPQGSHLCQLIIIGDAAFFGRMVFVLIDIIGSLGFSCLV